MNKDIDLSEILKNCPRGTKFYSYIFGEDTYFMGVSSYKSDGRPICIYGKYGEGQNFCLTRNGHAYADNYGECCIFPSKDQRDWSKFTAPWYKKEKFDPTTLNPFDKVLVRDMHSKPWRCSLFSHIETDRHLFPYATSGGYYSFCIPFNEDTRQLLGTTEEAPEYYRYLEE